MRNSALVESEQASIGETRMWQAVIVSTIREWILGPLRRQDEAEEYMFGGGTDFRSVCESAGMDVDRLRAKLGRLKRSSSALAFAMGPKLQAIKTPSIDHRRTSIPRVWVAGH